MGSSCMNRNPTVRSQAALPYINKFISNQFPSKFPGTILSEGISISLLAQLCQMGLIALLSHCGKDLSWSKGVAAPMEVESRIGGFPFGWIIKKHRPVEGEKIVAH